MYEPVAMCGGRFSGWSSMRVLERPEALDRTNRVATVVGHDTVVEDADRLGFESFVDDERLG